MTFIIDLQLFPCVYYIKLITNYTNVKLELYDRFQKMSFRNRYVIFGSNGLISLTVPVVGGREQSRLFPDVEIDYSQNWKIKHWRAIVSSYSNAPFFDYYEMKLKELFFEEEKHLYAFNI